MKVSKLVTAAEEASLYRTHTLLSPRRISLALTEQHPLVPLPVFSFTLNQRIPD